MGRTRKRYGNNDGGGFPLGQILGLAIGGGEINPAFGAEGPGGVDPEFEGDPSKAIAKHGTTQRFTDLNAFQKFYGERDMNKELAADQARADMDIANMPKKAKAQRQATDDARGELIARLTPAIQDMAARGMLPDLGLPAPIDPATPAGATLATRRLFENAELEKELATNHALPGLGAEVTAEQGAKTARNRLSATADTQSRSFREDNPQMVRDAMGAEFLRPSLQNRSAQLGIEEAELDMPWKRRGKQIGDHFFLNEGQTMPQDFVTSMPGSRGGIDPLTGLSTDPTPSLPITVRNGMAIVPKGAGGFGRAAATRGQPPPATPQPVTPDLPKPGDPQFIGPGPLVPSLNPRGALGDHRPHPNWMYGISDFLKASAEAAKGMPGALSGAGTNGVPTEEVLPGVRWVKRPYGNRSPSLYGGAKY
jgi:hypothetical protein